MVILFVGILADSTPPPFCDYYWILRLHCLLGAKKNISPAPSDLTEQWSSTFPILQPFNNTPRGVIPNQIIVLVATSLLWFCYCCESYLICDPPPRGVATHRLRNTALMTIYHVKSFKNHGFCLLQPKDDRRISTLEILTLQLVPHVDKKLKVGMLDSFELQGHAAPTPPPTHLLTVSKSAIFTAVEGKSRRRRLTFF